MNAQEGTVSTNKTVSYRRTYYLKHKITKLQKCKIYYQKNKQAILQRMKGQRFRDRDARSIRDKNRRIKHRQILYSLLGQKCVLCGYDKNILALHFDHINGGGRKEWRDGWKSHQNMIRYYAHHPEQAKEKLQVLCANCNAIKALTTSH